MARFSLASVLLFLICVLPASGQYLRVYYPDIEQGSAALVVSPSGQALLIDAGTGIKATEDGIEDFINDLIDAGGGYQPRLYGRDPLRRRSHRPDGECLPACATAADRNRIRPR